MNFSVRPGSLSPVIGLIHGAPYGGPSPKYSSILGCLGSANKPMYNRTQGRSMKAWHPNLGGVSALGLGLNRSTQPFVDIAPPFPNLISASCKKHQ